MDGRLEGDEATTAQHLRHWAEQLQAIARTGLGFTESLYERERYAEVLGVAADIARHADAGDLDPSHRVDEWMRQVGEGVAGYVTPKVTVGAVVGDDDGRLLLVQRADSGVWLYPTGWADVGYSAAEVAVKEVHEETGIECEPVGVLSVLDGMRMGFTRIPLYSVVFHCVATGGELKAHPLETADVGFFGPDELPDPVVGYDRWGPQAWAAIRGERPEPVWDPLRAKPWEGEHPHG